MQHRRPTLSPIVMALLALCLLCCACAKSAPAAAPAPSAPADSVQESPAPVQVSPAPGPSSSPSPSPSPQPSPFSFVWMTDTQALSYHVPDALDSMGDWISAKIETENIIGVFHTGDIVDNGFKSWEWDNFDLALQKFRGKIPFYPVAGNHDIGVRAQNYEGYTHCDFLNDFPPERKFGDGAVFYDLFSAGGTDFIVLGVGFDATRQFEGAFDWIDAVLQAHRDRVGIVLFHRYMDGKGETFKKSRENQERIVAANPNVRLVLCGHSSGVSTRYESYDDDGDGTAERRVCAMMFNLKGSASYGFLRLLRFDPLSRSIEIVTYSPYRDCYHVNRKTGESLDFTVEKGF